MADPLHVVCVNFIRLLDRCYAAVVDERPARQDLPLEKYLSVLQEQLETLEREQARHRPLPRRVDLEEGRRRVAFIAQVLRMRSSAPTLPPASAKHAAGTAEMQACVRHHSRVLQERRDELMTAAKPFAMQPERAQAPAAGSDDETENDDSDTVNDVGSDAESSVSSEDTSALMSPAAAAKRAKSSPRLRRRATGSTQADAQMERDKHEQLGGKLVDLSEQLKTRVAMIAEHLAMDNQMVSDLDEAASGAVADVDRQHKTLVAHMRDASRCVCGTYFLLVFVAVSFVFTYMILKLFPKVTRIVAVVALSTLLTVVSLVSIVTWTSRRSSSSALHASCERRPAIAASGSSPGDLPSNRTTTSALASSWPQTLSVAWPFSRYVAFHAERRRAPHARYLVWQCPAGIWKCGGIGDRARGIVYAFLLAVATERVFLIDLPANPVPLSETVRPNALDWLTDTAAVLALHDNVTIATRSGSTNPLLVHNMTEGALASAPVVIVRTSFEGWCTAVLEVGAFAAALDRFGVPNGPDVCRSGLLAELMLTWAWTTLMRPSPALLQATDAMRARLGVAGHEYVAVHMRGGDGEFRMNHERHRPETVVEFAACARTVGRVISGDKPRRLPVVVPFHVDRGLMHEGDPSPANLLTWAEWLLLAQARCIVTSSSGFSRLAVAASRHPGTGARCAFHFQACDEADVVAGWQ
ncbi:hypothetical protein PBRA_009070 [Plasmodiophora brassicae]|uniref:Uncharacterized protein n=1 Tax=Plasmodiophora brassicae TaxID=37360 RepID=A0A0G4J5B7_PLABS|nr:hypothetical protein PBRA_009070 [Plasmodiophora brassicae]